MAIITSTQIRRKVFFFVLCIERGHKAHRTANASPERGLSVFRPFLPLFVKPPRQTLLDVRR
jgi:hypothetical protein